MIALINAVHIDVLIGRMLAHVTIGSPDDAFDSQVG